MPNGDYRDAVDAANRIQRLSDDHWHLLDASCTAMDDDAWVGPVGRRFRDSVHAERRELRAQLAKAVHEAKTTLQRLAKHQ